jgi:hypothetical protein
MMMGNSTHSRHTCTKAASLSTTPIIVTDTVRCIEAPVCSTRSPYHAPTSYHSKHQSLHCTAHSAAQRSYHVFDGVSKAHFNAFHRLHKAAFDVTHRLHKLALHRLFHMRLNRTPQSINTHQHAHTSVRQTAI